MDDLLQTATRCPHCRASVRPGAPWCTLCHADLRPPPEPPQPVQPVTALPRPAFDPLTAPLEAVAEAGGAAPGATEATWPCSTCGARNTISTDACTACGAGFLAGLRETEGPLLEIPGVGDLTRLSRAQRVAAAFGVMLAFLLLTFVLGLAFG